MKLIQFALISTVLVGTSAQAATVKVTVDAKSGPWSTKANKKMKYGVGDEAPPYIVKGIPGGAVDKLEVYADGATSVAGAQDIGPSGLEDSEANDTQAKGKYYPSFYAPKLLYPTYRHALMVSFVDKDGGLVSRPFAVGKGIRVYVPEGAVGLALGFNDVTFKGNTGALTVTVNIPEQ